MNRMSPSSSFPTSTVNVAASAGWPLPSPSIPMIPNNPLAQMYIPVSLPLPAVPPSSSIPGFPGVFPTEQPFPSAPVLPGPLGTWYMLVPADRGFPVPLHPGSVPSPSPQPAPAVFLVPVPVFQPQPASPFAPAPSPLGLPTLAPASGNPAFWPTAPVGPMPGGPAHPPMIAAVTMNAPPYPNTTGTVPPGQPNLTLPSHLPVPTALAIVGYVVQPLPVPPGTAPMYSTLLPIFGMTRSPMPPQTAGNMMPPPPPSPSPMTDGTGREGAAHVLSPHYPNGARVIADPRAVRSDREAPSTAPQGAGGGSGVGVGAGPERQTGRSPRPSSSRIDDRDPTSPRGSGDASQVRPMRKPRQAMNGKH